jgi:RNA polymerase sigma-70 factor (ECF subfamily)
LLLRVARQPTDEKAWSEFVDRYGPRIARWCLAWGLQDADAVDVTQDVLSRLIVRLRQFQYDPARRFRAFLRKMTHDTVCDVFSAAARVHFIATGGSGTYEILAGLEAREDLVRRIEKEFDLELLEQATLVVRQQIEANTWEAYRLTTEERLSGAEAAAKLGMGVGAVYQAKSVVKKMLQEELRVLE